jgi:glycosyltransferase involved in cell wall biosynthesis
MMAYIVLIILAFALLQLLVALVNRLLRERLPARSTSPCLKTVSVLIPVRDEENNIGHLLGDLTSLTDRILEIILYDDHSTDNSTTIISTFARNDARIRLIHSRGLPEGWSGKNNGCHQLALEAKGDYLLFLDADVRVREGLVDRCLQYMLRLNTDLMSIFPTQEMQTLGEKITVPNMLIILLSLLPLPLVRRSRFSSLAAANGQLMLFDRKSYSELLPHERFRKSRAEDIETARYFKRRHRKVACLTGIDEVRCRMYDSLPAAVEGFAKNVNYFFGNSALLALIYWLVTTLGFIVFPIAGRTDLLWVWMGATLLTHILASSTARMDILQNLLLLLPQQLMLGRFIIRSITNNRKNRFRWKGRTI